MVFIIMGIEHDKRGNTVVATRSRYFHESLALRRERLIAMFACLISLTEGRREPNKDRRRYAGPPLAILRVASARPEFLRNIRSFARRYKLKGSASCQAGKASR